MTENSVLSPLSGDEAVLTRRYVGALYALAEEQGVVDAVAADLRGLRRLWGECPEWRFIACDPRLDQSMLGEAVQKIVEMTGLGDLAARFLAVLAQNRRLNILDALIEGFLQEVSTRRGEFRAAIAVARPLSASQRDALSSALNAVMGGKVHLAVTENPAILGGLTIKIGSQFIDASVKTKLDHLERMLKGAA